MIVIYNPTTMLPSATIEDPYPADMVTLYEELQSAGTVAFFEQPTNQSVHLSHVVNNNGVMSLQPLAVQTLSSPTTANAGDSVTISGFITGTSVSADGVPPVLLTDTSLTVTFKDQGVYNLVFSNPTCLDTSISITVT